MARTGENSPRAIHREGLKRVALDMKARGTPVTINAIKHPELKEWARKNGIDFSASLGGSLKSVRLWR